MTTGHSGPLKRSALANSHQTFGAAANRQQKFETATGLSAQTVTTTTVTTTTVTTYPPLKLPRVKLKKALAPEMYPLASVPPPAALEKFAIDVNGQNLYFSQRSLGANQTGEEILASIAANTSGDSTMLESVDHGYGHDQQLQRAMTPMYTQDDHQPNAYLESFEYPEVRRPGRGMSDRRSSSPQSPEATHGHFGRGTCSPSPRMHRTHVASPEPTTDSAEVDGASDVETDSGDGVHALPLPSPLLSPRARPEHMDTDETSTLEVHNALGHSAAR
ncbi:hypothetical protein J3F81_006318, partial [Coemansia sp. RSA 371]